MEKNAIASTIQENCTCRSVTSRCQRRLIHRLRIRDAFFRICDTVIQSNQDWIEIVPRATSTRYNFFVDHTKSKKKFRRIKDKLNIYHKYLFFPFICNICPPYFFFVVADLYVEKSLGEQRKITRPATRVQACGR